MWLAAMQLISVVPGRITGSDRRRAGESARGAPLLVLLPENFAPLASGRVSGRAEPLAMAQSSSNFDWAKSHGIWLVAGAMPTAIAGADHIHTSTLVFDPDGELQGALPQDPPVRRGRGGQSRPLPGVGDLQPG